jgi:hypothetical protein
VCSICCMYVSASIDDVGGPMASPSSNMCAVLSVYFSQFHSCFLVFSILYL